MSSDFNKLFFHKLKVQAGLLACILFLLLQNGCRKEPTEMVYETPYVWVVGEQTVMKSLNEGVDWYDCIANEDIKQFATVQNKDQVYRSVSFFNSVTGCISGDYGFFASTKNGKVFQGTEIGHSDYTLYASAMLDTNNIILCGDNSEVYSIISNSIRGKSGGIGFSAQNLDLKPNLYGLDFFDASSGWVVGDNSIVAFTKNNGFGWTLQKTAPDNIYNAVHIHRVDSTLREVWIAGEKGVIFTSSDDGDTWNQVEQEVTSTGLTSIFFTARRTGYFAGKNGVIMKTTDNGFHFEMQNTGTTENINSISFMNENVGIAVGDHGTYLKTTDAGKTWIRMPWYSSKNLYGVSFVKRFLKK